jgi:hypothetical protein
MSNTEALQAADIERMAREAGLVNDYGAREIAHTPMLTRFAVLVRAQALEDVRGGHDLDAMCEALHRVIEAHADKHSPFHQPINADAMIALRILRGVAAAIRAIASDPKEMT